VGGVGDVEISGAIHRYPKRRVELRAGGRAAITRMRELAIPRYGGYVAAGKLADAVVKRVREVYIAGPIHCDSGRLAHLDFVGGAAIAGEALIAVADGGSDLAGRIDLADAVGAVLGDEDIAR